MNWLVGERYVDGAENGGDVQCMRVTRWGTYVGFGQVRIKSMVDGVTILVDECRCSNDWDIGLTSRILREYTSKIRRYRYADDAGCR